jgi:hypothetical protein
VATRMYIVGPVPASEAEPARLIEASTQAEAIRHVARKYRAEVASGIQIRDLMRAGVIPEVAGDEPAGEAP